MAEDYFLNCHSEESIKVRYKKLAKELHPDKHQNSIEAKQRFQEMINQRDKAIKAMYFKSGKSQIEIDAMMKDFVMNLDKLDFTNLNGVAEKLGEAFINANPDKEPTFKDMFKFVLGNLISAEGKKNIESKTPGKQLPPQK